MQWGKQNQIPQGIKPTTTGSLAQSQQIQFTSHQQSLTSMEAEKSTWFGKVNPPADKTAEEISREAEEEITRAARLA
jgi:hypothetical protein